MFQIYGKLFALSLHIGVSLYLILDPFFRGKAVCFWNLINVHCYFRDPNALWNVEDNFYDKLPNISLADMAPGMTSEKIPVRYLLLGLLFDYNRYLLYP